MKLIILLPILILSFLLFSGLSYGYVFMATNSSGLEKTSFLTNESMYIIADNITNGSSSVNIFLVTHNGTLNNQTVLTSSAVLGPVNISTIASGGFDVTLLWTPNLVQGVYDLVADVNKNNIYDSGSCWFNGDCLYNAGGSGITVTRAPIPVLIFSSGPKSPPPHTYTYDPNNLNNAVLQIKITGDLAEPILMSSFDFVPSGTGNDKTGISLVKMFDDLNGNGVVDQGEPLVGYGQYMGDDGVLRIDLSSSPYKIQSNTTVYFLVQYTMSNLISNGQTFSTQLVSVTATGQNTLQKAVVSGLSVKSNVLTVAGGTGPTTVSNTTTSFVTTTTTPKDQCSKDSDCGSPTCSNGNQVTPICKLDTQKGSKVCTTSSENIKCCPGEKCGIDMNIILLLAAAVAAFMIPAVYFLFIRKPKIQPELYRGPS